MAWKVINGASSPLGFLDEVLEPGASYSKPVPVLTSRMQELRLRGILICSGADDVDSAITSARVDTVTANNRTGGWSLGGIVSKPTRSQSNTVLGGTLRQEVVFPFDVTAVKFRYSNSYAGSLGGTPGADPFVVKAALQVLNASLTRKGSSAGDLSINDTTALPRAKIPIGGRNQALIEGGAWADTDLYRARLKGNTRNFLLTHVAIMPYPPPSAPTLATSASGGSLAAGLWCVIVTVCYPGGYETPGSVGATQLTTGTTSTITVTGLASASYPGAIGYRTWLCNVGTTTPGWPTGKGIVPMDTNTVITASGTVNQQNAMVRKLNGVTASRVSGYVTNGGVTAGSSDNGEYYLVGTDCIDYGFVGTANINGSGLGAIMAWGYDANKVHGSLTVNGDSITNSSGDEGFMNSTGLGWAMRACYNQYGLTYDPTIAPRNGCANFSIPSETFAQYLGNNGNDRREWSLEGTCNLNAYLINDFANGDTASSGVAMTVTDSTNVTGAGLQYFKSTVGPRTQSTDGHTTIANQRQVSIHFNGARRQYNNWLTYGSSIPVVNEALFGSYATQNPMTDYFKGTDGACTTYQTALPFVIGTEVVKVNGVSKALTTDYTYYGQVDVVQDGVLLATIASGIVFNSALVDGLSVRANYTPIAGFQTICGPNAHHVDHRGTVDVDENGNPGGHWWRVDTDPPILTGTVTGSNTSSTLNATFAATDIHRNLAVCILTDTGNPAAVGQVTTIARNTLTQLTVTSWSNVPSSAATFKIYNPYTRDGVHDTARGHILRARAPATQAMLAIMGD